ncbi:MAG: mobile mystery protein A [Stellaceae bacterium]
MKMRYERATEAREILDAKFQAFRPVSKFTAPPKGWVRTIRRALGMSARQLANRLHQSQPRIADIEKREIDGALTIRTLRRVAQALDCTFVYALVPNDRLEKIVREQATKIANRRMRAVTHTMALEDQAVSKATSRRQRAKLIQRIIDNELAHVWDEQH